MNLGLENKIIIVAGNPCNVVEGITRILCRELAIVVNLGSNEEYDLKLVKEIEKAGGSVFFFSTDLNDPAACEEAVRQVIHKFGRIDGLVNNAGLTLVDCYLMAHFSLPFLKKTKGSIINISFKSAETGSGDSSPYPYVVGGRNALTREWAVELLKYGIRSNAVVISESRNPQIQPRPDTFNNPEEIGHTVGFLLSEKSSHTTGQLINVSGR